jgi:Uma2 family endonuclease
MIAECKEPAVTVEEYLALEAASRTKHEYVRGYIQPMDDVTLAHDTIANNVRAAVHNHLAEGPCVVRGPDLLVRVREDIYYYPDTMVTCDATLAGSAIAVSTPCLLVEVLSDSTEAVDRGGKFADYQTLPTLMEYLLVDSRRRSVEIYHRAEHNSWLYERYTANDSISLESIGLTCSVAALYRHTQVK